MYKVLLAPPQIVCPPVAMLYGPRVVVPFDVIKVPVVLFDVVIVPARLFDVVIFLAVLFDFLFY